MASFLDAFNVDWTIIFICMPLMAYFIARTELLFSGDTERIEEVLAHDYYLLTEGFTSHNLII